MESRKHDPAEPEVLIARAQLDHQAKKIHVVRRIVFED